LRRAPLIFALLTILATAAFFCEYLPPFKHVHLFSDIEVYHYPLQRFAIQSLKEGRLPQWDPSIYCGIPFIAEPQAALFYPPNWILYALNLRAPHLPFKALEYFAFAHVWIAFVLCYLWLRARRLDPMACVLASMVFACGGYMLWQIVHLGVAPALTWMPLALWGIDDAIERRDWRCYWKTALASALYFLAGYPPSFLAFCTAALLYALASRAHFRAAIGAALAILASALLAAVQWLPTLEALPFMYSEERYAGELRSVFPPIFIANWQNLNRPSPNHYLGVMYLYWGLPALFAIVWILYRRRITPYAQPLIVIAGCLLLLLDPGGLIYKLIAHIPALENTAQSYNFYEGVVPMAALLAAIAITDFRKAGPTRALPVPVALAAVLMWSTRQIWIWARGGNFASGPTALIETAIALTLFALALLTHRARPTRLAAAAVLLMAFCDYKVFGTNRLFNTVDGDVDDAHPAYGIHGMSDEAYRILEANRHYRVASDQAGGPKSVDYRMWGLATPQGLDPLLTRRYQETVERWTKFRNNREFEIDFRNADMMQSLGIRYVVTHQGATSAAFVEGSPDYRPLAPGTSYYRVYEYLHARPSYRWNHSDDTATPVGWLRDRRVFQLHSAQGGSFELVEQSYPGWSATIDGQPTLIQPAHAVFQSVLVPPGDHVVVFQYRSRWLVSGVVISLAALLALLYILRYCEKAHGTFPRTVVE
jgi:hypothetical protein